MAFEIAKPDVGTKLLLGFKVMADFNRRRQEQELREARMVQDMALKEEALAIRGSLLDERGKLILAQAEAAKALASKRTSDITNTQNKTTAFNDVYSAWTEPGEDGLSLQEKVAKGDKSAWGIFTRRISGSVRNSDGAKQALDEIEKSLDRGGREAKTAFDQEYKNRMEQRRIEAAAEAKRHHLEIEKRYSGGDKEYLTVEGRGRMTVNSIRKILARGGEEARALREAMKRPPKGVDAEGGALPPLFDDKFINELEKQGKELAPPMGSGGGNPESGSAVDFIKNALGTPTSATSTEPELPTNALDYDSIPDADNLFGGAGFGGFGSPR